MARKIDFICSDCGEDHSIYWDSTTYWNADTQQFESDGDPSGEALCGNCGSESSAITVDKETREELATGPDWRDGYMSKAEADAKWTEHRKAMDADRADKALLKQAMANAEVLAAAYEVAS